MPNQGGVVDFTATVNPVLKPTSDRKPMEQIKRNYFGGANFEARTVKDIIAPAKSISNKVSVRAALDQMQAQATDSSPVIDQCGELDRKSTRLNSSHDQISYAVFCLKKK